MQKRITKKIEDLIIPEYVIDILTEGIADCFLKMNISRSDGGYLMSYDTGYFKPVDLSVLEYVERLKLIRTLTCLNETAEDHLIPGDTYLLKWNLIYSCGSGTNKSRVRIMYVPDKENRAFSIKMAEAVCEAGRISQPGEEAVFKRFAEYLENEGTDNALRYLDKSISRACRSSGDVV